MWIESLAVRLLNSMVRRPQHKTPPGVVLGSRTDPLEYGAPVVWPEARLCEHAVVIGKTGTGKSHFLEHTAWQHMQQGRGLCYIDPHGDTAKQLTARSTLLPDAADRLLIFDPTDPQNSPGLNPLELSGDDYREAFTRTSELTAILRQRWGVDSFGARSEELLRAVLFTAAVNGLTLVDIPLILTSAQARARLTATLPSPDIRAYWQERFEPLSEAMKAVFREPILNKITSFLLDPALRHVLGQQHSTINFAEAMREGKWLVINLAKGLLGEHAHTLGNLIVAKLQFDIMSRARIPVGQRRVFAVICDEVQNLAENDLATLLTEGRKYGSSLLTGNQHWEQLPASLRGALLSAGTHIFFRVSSSDARVLAPELAPTARQRYVGELTNQPRGYAIVRIGADEPVKIHVPPLPRLSDEQHEQARILTSRSQHRYTRGRAAIEADIEQRQRELMQSPEPFINHTTNETQHTEGQDNW